MVDSTLVVTTTKELALDLGKNTIAMLEALARQLGVTASQVWPWYVKQQILYGVLSLGMLVLSLFVGAAGLCWCYRHEWEDVDAKMVCIIVGCMLIVGAFIGCLMVVPTQVSRILNPEYFAMQELLVALRGGAPCP